MITIGIDLGIHKIAWSVWDDDVLLETQAVEQHGLRHQELNYFRGVAERLMPVPPGQVFIEDVLIGNNRKYSIQLAETKGAVLAGLGKWSEDIPVIPVNVSTWKKEVLGNGRADKQMVRFWLEDRSNAYSVLCGNDQDRFDAACIGFYGYVVSKRAQALAESGFSYRSERT